MITLRGWVFFITGAGILAAGILRMELAALLWGTLILALFLYSLLAGLIIRVQIRRQSLTVESGADIVEEGDSIRFPIAISRLPLRPPGFRLRLELGLRWAGVDLGSTLPVFPGSQTPSIVAAHRGAYDSPESRLIYEDVFAFVRVARGDDHRLSVAVIPQVGSEQLERLSTPHGAKATHNQRRIASDEFLEIRPYIPGDDPRRLSWKHYAQLGDLMIRTGEPVPPPADEMVCVIDSGCDAAATEEINRNLADSVVRRALSVIYGALAHGDSVVVSLVGLPQPITLSGSAGSLDLSAPLSAEAKSILRALAGFQVGPEPGEPVIPVNLRGEVVVIGSESSPTLSSLVARVRSGGGTARVILLSPPAVPRGRLSLARLIYRDSAYA